MKELKCKDCRHFRQHYIRFGRSYREAHCGHCVYPRVKRRTPDTAICPNFSGKGENSAKDTPNPPAE